MATKQVAISLSVTPIINRSIDKSAVQPLESSSRVNIEKIDQLINLAGELVITQAMLVAINHCGDHEGNELLQRDIYQLDRK